MNIFPSASEVLSIDRGPIVKGDPTPLHVQQQSQRPSSDRRMQQPQNRFKPPAFNQSRRFEENVNNAPETQALDIAIENYSEILQTAENDIQQFDVFDHTFGETNIFKTNINILWFHYFKIVPKCLIYI